MDKKIVYLLKNPGIRGVTPKGFQSVVISADENGHYSDESFNEIIEADIIIVGLEPVTRSIIERSKHLKLIQRLGAGYDNIDLEAASEFGIPVCNMQDFNSGTVAEHTVMLILSLLKKVFDSTLILKAGRWSPATIANKGIYDLQGRTVGILGFGLIGSEVAKRIRAFGVDIIYHDKIRIPEETEIDLGVTYCSLEIILSKSDILTIHLPLTEETRLMLGAGELSILKSGAFLINTARGAIVDEYALSEMLKNGKIAGAGIDVFSKEPIDPGHPY